MENVWDRAITRYDVRCFPSLYVRQKPTLHFHVVSDGNVNRSGGKDGLWYMR